MYENESDAVRLGIEFLTALTEKDYLTDSSFDPVDLENKLDEIEEDVNTLVSNLPVEAIDDEEELEEYSGDFEDSEELEDEVVECERLIAQAQELLAYVREYYMPAESDLSVAPDPEPEKPAGPEPIMSHHENPAITPKEQPTGHKYRLSEADRGLVYMIIIWVIGVLICVIDELING